MNNSRIQVTSPLQSKKLVKLQVVGAAERGAGLPQGAQASLKGREVVLLDSEPNPELDCGKGASQLD